jgi:hypothetical protein
VVHLGDERVDFHVFAPSPRKSLTALQMGVLEYTLSFSNVPKAVAEVAILAALDL